MFVKVYCGYVCTHSIALEVRRSDPWEYGGYFGHSKVVYYASVQYETHMRETGRM